MTTKPEASQGNKLQNLRVFLLVCFLGVSICCSVITVTPLLILNPPGRSSIIRIFNVPLPDINLPLPALAFLTILVLTCFAGGGCVGVYYLLKSRIQKEAESYLEGDNDETPD